MIFRQLFHDTSCTYTYILASRQGGEALIIDPVLERVDRYVQLLQELGLKLVKALDTHVHADHVSGLPELRARTKCITVMAEKSKVDRVSQRVREGDTVEIENISLTVIETPGHTPGSLCFYDAAGGRVFTGDTMLIRGTGRTDFQEGSARAQYDSIFNKLLTLPDDTLVYPGHDYKGDTVSTIGEEKAHNPRLQVGSAEEYAAIMDNLNLADPKMMDVAVPANLRIGLEQDTPEAASWSLTVAQVLKERGRPDVVLVDLREEKERARHGVIPRSIHAPYTQLDDFVKPGGLLREMAAATGKRLIYYCAAGERSAMAVESSKAAGLENVSHLKGGMEAWAKQDAPIEK